MGSMETHQAQKLGHLQADPRSTLAYRTFFHGFYLLLLIQEKQVVGYWRNKMVAK